MRRFGNFSNSFISPWLLFVLLLSLSACGQTPTSAPVEPVLTPLPAPVGTPTAFVPAETVTLRFASWADVEETARLEQVISEINADTLEYQIVHEADPLSYYETLQVGLAEGAAPDLFWLGQEWILPLASQGVLADLSPYLQADLESPAADLSDYFPEILRAYEFEGAYYGLPYAAYPVLLYYHPALFDAAGLEPPSGNWTWADLERAAAALTVDEDGDGRNDRWGFVMEDWPPPQLFIWQAGGEVISRDRSTSPVDSPEAVQALEFYSRLIYDDEHTPPREVLEKQSALELVSSQQVAMIMSSAGDGLDEFIEYEMSAAPVPAGPAARATYAGGTALAVSARSARPDLAYQALIRLAEALQRSSIVSPRRSLASPRAIIQADPLRETSAEAIAAAAEQMRAPVLIPRQDEWDVVFWDELVRPLVMRQEQAAELARQVRPLLESFLP